MKQTIRGAKVFGDNEDSRARLSALFGGEMPEGGQPPAPALEWARNVLKDHPTGSDVAAIAMLRRAEPQLTLKTATFLAAHAAQH